MKMNSRCNECGATLYDDEVHGERICYECGLVTNDSVLEDGNDAMVRGDSAHSQVSPKTRLTDRGLEGTTFDSREVRSGSARGLWRRLSKHQNRARRGRRVFADDVMDHIRSLGLGRDLEIAVKAVITSTLVAQPDEKVNSQELGNLPLNEIRIIRRCSRLERERIAAVAALITAASMGMITACRITSITAAWKVERSDCNELAKRMKKRLIRMRKTGRVTFAANQRPSRRRKAALNDALGKLRSALCDSEKLAPSAIKKVILNCLDVLRRLGEPEDSSATPNERMDMLVATVAKEVTDVLGLHGLNACIARGLGLSPGGVCQRHRLLKPLFKYPA